MDSKLLEEIALAGIQAPSADNRLDYQFEFQDAAIVLWAGPAYLAHAERHQQIMGLFAFGAMVENMLIRARDLGCEGRCDWFPGDDRAQVARLSFVASENPRRDELAAAIPLRQSNRHVLFKGPVTSEHQAQLAAQAQESSGARVVWLEGERRRKALSLIWLAESARFRSRHLHEELFSSVRFELGWKATADRGLPPAALEVEAPMRPFFAALRKWPLMQAANLIGTHRMMGLRAGYLPCRMAPALGVVTTSLDPEREGAIAAGRAFERLWLEATRQRLVLQPMAASAVLPLQHARDQGASAEACDRLSAGWAEICEGGLPLMVFRLGNGQGTPAPTVKTGRRSLSELTRQAGV